MSDDTQPRWSHLDPAWADVRERTINVRGRPVHALCVDSEGPTPQLLVHGLGGSSINWVEVLTPLAAYGPVVAIDLPGFGRSPVPDGGSARPRANAAFVRALLDELDWYDTTVHGNSMGGLISTLAAAADRDGRIGNLVLVAPALVAKVPSRKTVPTVAAAGLPLVTPFTAGRVARLWMGQMERGTVNLGVVIRSLCGEGSVRAAAIGAHEFDLQAQAEHTPLRTRADSFVQATRSLTAMMVAGHDIHAALRAVSVPTLLIAGGRDRLVPQAALDDVAARTGWTYAVLPDVGHVPMLEVPDVYLELVADFVG